jgi:GNAT superfamily N-acetyltransferase
MRVERVSTPATYPLRHQMLRPGRPIETVYFGGDDAPGTVHFGAFDDSGALVGVVTLLQAALPEGAPSREARVAEDIRTFQLRGMATSPAVRGQGYGVALVRACLDHVGPGGAIWCNARVTALAFYARFGFVAYGAEFDIPMGGPHFKMVVYL